MGLNNVNIGSLKVFIEDIKRDPSNARIRPKVSGSWVFDEGGIQFRSDIEYEKGVYRVEADMPSRLGGWGNRPGPLHWCLYGVASCFAYTFAAVAALEGVELKSLSVEVESDVNLSKVFGLSDDPIINDVSIRLSVDSEADPAVIGRLRRLALERCPAIYCLSNEVKVSVDIV